MKDLEEADDIQLAEPRVDGVSMEVVFLPISIEDYEVLGEKGFDFQKRSDVGTHRP